MVAVPRAFARNLARLFPGEVSRERMVAHLTCDGRTAARQSGRGGKMKKVKSNV